MTNRRTFLRESTATAVALAFPLVAGAQPKALKVGILHPVTGGFRGVARGTGAALVADQYAGGWRVSGDEGRSPDRIFGWAMRLPVRGAGKVFVSQPSQTPRRLEIAFLALAWVLALWVTRKQSRS